MMIYTEIVLVFVQIHSSKSANIPQNSAFFEA